MKHLLLLFILSSVTNGFSQKDDLKDTLEAKFFWTDNILNIIDLKEEKILEQTNFPLIVDGERLGKEEFRLEMANHFNSQIRDELRSAPFSRLKVWYIGDDLTPTYMVPCLEVLDKERYLAVVFVFFQYDGKWKLKEIDYE